MRKRERKKQTISRKQLFIEEKISSLRRPDLQGGEKTSTISLRTTREFFIPISYIKNCTKSNSLSANKYPGSAADSTRRRSGNLRARKLLLVLSLRLPSPLRFFFLFPSPSTSSHRCPTLSNSLHSRRQTISTIFRVSSSGKFRLFNHYPTFYSNNSLIRAETS